MAEIAERAFQKFYPKLSEVLPISSIVTDFYSQGLLAGDHKANIDALDTQKRKAEYFLDYVIKPGLKVGYTGQFDKMLRVMEISDDPAVQFVVGEIRKFSEMSREPETPPKQDLTADLRRTAEPSQPKELSVLKITEAAITLSWKESNPSDVSIVGYEVQYRKSGEEFKKVEKSLTHEDLTCEVTGLLANTEYQFKVAAINKAGCGTFTDIVTQFTSFDYTGTAKLLRIQLDKLLKLNYDNMKTSLYANGVITTEEKRIIDSKFGRKQMEYLIVEIIIPSLELGYGKKYKSFLKAMEDNEDTNLQYTAKMLAELSQKTGDKRKRSTSESDAKPSTKTRRERNAETGAPSACFGVNMQSSPTQIKLFISYAWEKATNDFVVKLKTDLEARGLQIFLDKHDILPGDNIQHEVAKGINEADGIIIVYSERYPDSQWCSQELQMAQNLRKKVFPIRRIKGPYQRNVNLPIGGILCANFTLDNEVEYQNSLASLIRGIEKNCMKEI